MVPLIGTAVPAAAEPNEMTPYSCSDSSFSNSFGYFDTSYTRAGPRSKSTDSYVYMNVTSITSGRTIMAHVDAWNGSSYIDASQGNDYEATNGTTLLLNWVIEYGYNSAAIAYRKSNTVGGVDVAGVWSPDYC